MTDEELDKALDKITDQTADAIIELVKEANEQTGKILLRKYDPMEMDKAQQAFDLRLKEIKQSFQEQVKILITIEESKQ